MPFMALNQKIISALTTGEVPDLIFHIAPWTLLPQNAWNDKIVEVSDIVEAHKSELSQTALLTSSYYNSVTKRRGYYLVPLSQGAEPFHIWGDLVEQAGSSCRIRRRPGMHTGTSSSRCSRCCAARECGRSTRWDRR